MAHLAGEVVEKTEVAGQAAARAGNDVHGIQEVANATPQAKTNVEETSSSVQLVSETLSSVITSAEQVGPMPEVCHWLCAN